MNKETSSFLIRLIGFTILLFLIHTYIIYQFFEEQLYFPIWTIYIFNAVLVCIVYFILNYKVRHGSKKMYELFLGLTMLKMGLAIVFLLPLFFGKSDHSQLEVINFFIPYFLFLAFEIFSLNKFLQKD
ncbi:hypothetical protein EB822_09530 [Flavobacteriaceae bacterium PRS1]|nr:hypothetical protein EB822_09530 [Flavobacteriaceae bacterium PRS1]